MVGVLRTYSESAPPKRWQLAPPRNPRLAPMLTRLALEGCNATTGGGILEGGGKLRRQIHLAHTLTPSPTLHARRLPAQHDVRRQNNWAQTHPDLLRSQCCHVLARSIQVCSSTCKHDSPHRPLSLQRSASVWRCGFEQRLSRFRAAPSMLSHMSNESAHKDNNQ